MKTAFLHIGTEKTGTTSIQSFLFAHRKRLAARGCLFPESAGYVSNQRLVTYAKRRPDSDIAPPELEFQDPQSLSDWKERFLIEHCNEVLPFLAESRRSSAVVYSSEHMHSRVNGIDEIRRIARVIRPMVDRVRVIVYLRRQDLLARSAYSTTVRFGQAAPFAFESVNERGPYYDHRRLLDDWAGVFGEQAMEVRAFERGRLVEGDVVSDFIDAADLVEASHRLPRPPTKNEALSWTAQSVLRAFNARDPDDERLRGLDRHALRGFLIGELERLEDGHGDILPSRDSAMAFLGHFEEANREVAERWLGGQGFSADFDRYPENPVPPPAVVDADERLDALVDVWRLRESAAA